MQVSNQILEFAIIALTIATITAIVTRRLRLPYTVGLVVIGLIISLFNRLEIVQFPEFTADIVNFVENIVTPELILGMLVTPLVFEAAFHLGWDDLKHDLPIVLALAIPGVLITTLLVGLFLYIEADILGLFIPVQVVFVFGAMMAATDPISVVALFRTLGVPKRLQVLLEGESLFNDGTAIVVFSLVLSITLSSINAAHSPENNGWVKFLFDFVIITGGGLVIGFILGWLGTSLIRIIDDPLIETTVTTVLAFGAYLIATNLNVSGIIAVVIAGLVSGNIGPKGMSPTTHILVSNFWEYISFLSNSVVFLLIGLEVNPAELIDKGQLILLAILAVLLARAVVVYGLSWIGKNISIDWRHILFWGGLRGAISLALALSLPFELGNQIRSSLQNMAFGVVIFSILVQGITMEPLVRRLGLLKRSEMQDEYERRHARAVAARAAYNHLYRMHQEGLLSDHSWELLAPLMKEHASALAETVKEVMEYDPTVEAQEFEAVRRETLRAQKSTLIGLLTDGVISEDIYSQLIREVDDQLYQDPGSWMQIVKTRIGTGTPVEKLLTAVVQIQDAENAINALNNAQVFATRLPSTGGFLGRRNITLLIGTTAERLETALMILNKSCRKRVEYKSTHLEGSPIHLPLTAPIEVGGAIIFTIDVERWEEF